MTVFYYIAIHVYSRQFFQDCFLNIFRNVACSYLLITFKMISLHHRNSQQQKSFIWIRLSQIASGRRNIWKILEEDRTHCSPTRHIEDRLVGSYLREAVIARRREDATKEKRDASRALSGVNRRRRVGAFPGARIYFVAPYVIDSSRWRSTYMRVPRTNPDRVLSRWMKNYITCRKLSLHCESRDSRP